MIKPKFVESNLDSIIKYLVYEEKRKAFLLLKPTDWMVLRQLEDATNPIPTAISFWRRSIRQVSRDNCDAWSSCSSLQEIFSLMEVSPYIEDDSTATFYQNPDSVIQFYPPFPFETNSYTGEGY